MIRWKLDCCELVHELSWEPESTNDFIDVSQFKTKEEQLEYLNHLKVEAVANYDFEKARAIRDQQDRIDPTRLIHGGYKFNEPT